MTVNEYIRTQNFTVVDWLITDRPHLFGLIPGWANPTGVILIIILFIMYVCSMKWVRKGGYFEVGLKCRKTLFLSQILREIIFICRSFTGRICFTLRIGYC